MTMAVRAPQETSAINRMLQSHGLGKLDEAGMIPALGFLVQDHEHLRSLLARCEPEKRADMYNCLAANTRFPAHPLDWYMAQTAEKAANQHLPTLEPDGSYKFDPTVTPEFGDIPEASVSPAAGASFIAAAIEKVKDIQGAQFGVDTAFSKHTLTTTCRSCTKQDVFVGATKDDCVQAAHRAGWVHYKNFSTGKAVDICPDCPAIRQAKTEN
jgi:hypothetical protein